MILKGSLLSFFLSAATAVGACACVFLLAKLWKSSFFSRGGGDVSSGERWLWVPASHPGTKRASTRHPQPCWGQTGLPVPGLASKQLPNQNLFWETRPLGHLQRSFLLSVAVSTSHFLYFLFLHYFLHLLLLFLLLPPQVTHCAGLLGIVLLDLLPL